MADRKYLSSLGESRADRWINKAYFVLFPLLLGATLIVLVLAMQNANRTTELTRQTQKIAEQNRAYLRCTAKLFAAHTQNQRPVVIEDLEKCAIAEDEANAHNTEQGPQNALMSPSAQPRTQNAQPQNSPSDNATPTTPPNPSLLEQLGQALSPVLGEPSE